MGIFSFIQEVGERLLGVGQYEGATPTTSKASSAEHVARLNQHTRNKYAQIFEANQSVLKHLDKIFPGQLRRIPAA